MLRYLGNCVGLPGQALVPGVKYICDGLLIVCHNDYSAVVADLVDVGAFFHLAVMNLVFTSYQESPPSLDKKVFI